MYKGTMTRTVAIASDHAGFALKEALKPVLAELGLAVLDCGTNSTDSVDYPDFGEKCATAILNGEAEKGIIICGSGIGISIAANRHPGIRAALCHSPETAALAREHNDANILALGARITDEATARACVEAFFTTQFAGGRHATRVEKLG